MTSGCISIEATVLLILVWSQNRFKTTATTTKIQLSLHVEEQTSPGGKWVRKAYTGPREDGTLHQK